MSSPALSLCILALLACALTAPAADAKKKDDAPDLPKVLMATPGKLLLDEPFTAESWKKNWSAYKGDFQSVGDQLRVAEKPADGHHPEASHQGPVHNVIVRFKFKYDGCNWMGFSFSDKEHVARIMIQSDGFELVKMSGIGPTTKGQRLDRVTVKWDPTKWYTMTIELLANELIASVDEQYVLYGTADGLDIDKGRIALIVGGQYGWYDELKMWEALPDARWAKRKPLVQVQKDKHR